MALTIKQANLEIQKLIDEQANTGKKVITKDALNNIINQLSVDAGGGKTTVLYSAAEDLTKGLVDNPDVRILDKIQASKFLIQAKELSGDGKSNSFTDALTILYNEEPDLEFSGANTNKANIFVNGIDGDPRTPGAWDTISKNFVEAGSGDIDNIKILQVINNDGKIDRQDELYSELLSMAQEFQGDIKKVA